MLAPHSSSKASAVFNHPFHSMDGSVLHFQHTCSARMPSMCSRAHRRRELAVQPLAAAGTAVPPQMRTAENTESHLEEHSNSSLSPESASK